MALHVYLTAHNFHRTNYCGNNNKKKIGFHSHCPPCSTLQMSPLISHATFPLFSNQNNSLSCEFHVYFSTIFVFVNDIISIAKFASKSKSKCMVCTEIFSVLRLVKLAVFCWFSSKEPIKYKSLNGISDRERVTNYYLNISTKKSWTIFLLFANVEWICFNIYFDESLLNFWIIH